MATYYAVGSPFTWTTAGPTTNWSTTSGGVGGQKPLATDTVIFDSNSGTGTVTWTTGNCLSLSTTGGTGQFAGTITGTTAQTIAGSLTLGSSVNWTQTGTVTFSATTTGNTITTGGNTMPSCTFSGAAGGWTLQDSFTTYTTSTITLTKGTLSTNAQTCNWGLFSTSGATARALNITNSTINLTGTGAIWGVAGSNLTFTSTGSQINTTDTSATGKNLAFGALAYNNINFVGCSGFLGVSGTTPSFNTFSNTPGGEFIALSSIATLTCNNFSINGSPTNVGSYVSFTTGTQVIVNVTNPSTCSYISFEDVNASGATINALTGGISGGNNINILFPNPYLVQTAVAGVTTSATTLSATYTRNTVKGNFLIVNITCSPGTITGITDAQGNTYHLATSITQGLATLYQYYAYSTAGGSTNATKATISATGQNVNMTVREYGGITLSNPLDQTATGSGSSTSLSTATTSSTTYYKELIVSACYATSTPSEGFLWTNFVSEAVATTVQVGTQELIMSATGGISAIMTQTTSGNWAMVVGTYRVLPYLANSGMLLGVM